MLPGQIYEPNADSVRVISQCRTELTYDDDLVSFTVRCLLDAGHGGRHRGSAMVEFAGIALPHITNIHNRPGEMPRDHARHHMNQDHTERGNHD